VARISESGSGNLTVTYENIEGDGMTEAEHDLVVLSIGAISNPEAFSPFKKGQVTSGPYGFVHEQDQDLDPGRTSLDGVFVAGAASETRDIPDSIVHAGAAAAQAAAYIARFDHGTVDEEKVD
jgi:heterodisulfide reductase subunit A